MATLMKVDNNFATGEETARTGHKYNRPTEEGAPIEDEGPHTHDRARNRGRKCKNGSSTNLVAATREAGQRRNKKRREEDKFGRPSHSYEEIMSGPCKYHSHGA